MAGNVLHLERQRAGALGVDERRVRPHQLRDAGADGRVVVGGLDAEPPQRPVADLARRLIDRVGDQDVVARLGERQQCCRDGRGAGRRQPRARPAFQLRDGRLQRLRGGRAAPAVGVALVAPLEAVERPEEDGRAAVDGGVDKAVVGEGVSPRVHDIGRGAPGLLAVVGAGHSRLFSFWWCLSLKFDGG